jgi:hypothetical protein
LDYCCREGGDIPCQRMVICWQPYFPVEAYLRKWLSAEQKDRYFGLKPKEKIVSLVELVEEAKDRLEANGHGPAGHNQQ